MVRFFLLMVSLVTLGAGAVADVSSPKAEVDADQGLHGRRTSSYYKKVYCDSHDCPYGYDLVDDADDVKCKNYKCTKKQCCEKDYDYCDSYKCPNHYSLKKDADDIKCSYSGCTKSKCWYYHCEA